MKQKTLFRAVLIPALLFMVFGCYKAASYRDKSEEMPMVTGDYEGQDQRMNDGLVSQTDEFWGGESVQNKLSFNSAADLDRSVPSGNKGDKSKSGDQQEEQKPKRIYSGAADLVVDDLEKTKTGIETLAVSSGGYVESVYDTSIVIRVPAAEFDKIFRAILELGKIVSQSVETADITELYSDLAGRLSIAVTSRNRLYELLKRTTDTNEQVLILKEIGRLTEEIENIRLILQNLDNYISYSRISVTLTPRLAMEQSDKYAIPFTWLRNLDPLSPSGRKLKASVSLKPGDEYAVFSGKKVYRAESFTGSRLYIFTVPNRPRGDSRFWQEALLFHLSPFYSGAEKLDRKFGKSDLHGVLFTSKDQTPFQLFVGVIADRGDLHVIQIFSPSEDPAVFEGLFAALEKGSIR
jgi:hypothetical protein